MSGSKRPGSPLERDQFKKAMADISTPKVVNIDPRGDVILVPPGARLRVSTKVLSLASDVFAAMFSDKFSEGQAIKGAAAAATNSPPEIQLPEDQADVLEILCKVLHHYQISTEQRMASSKDLVRLAIAADKWQCMQAVSPALERYWREINEHFTKSLVPLDYEHTKSLKKIDSSEYENLLIVAAALERKDLFRIASGRLMLLQPNDCATEEDKDHLGAFFLPEKTLEALDNARAKIRTTAVREFARMGRRFDLTDDSLFDSDHYPFGLYDTGNELQGILIEFLLHRTGTLFDFLSSMLGETSGYYGIDVGKKLDAMISEAGLCAMKWLQSTDGMCLSCLNNIGKGRLASACCCKGDGQDSQDSETDD